MLAAFVLLASPRVASARFFPTRSLQELIAWSPIIATVRVELVAHLDGITVAKATVLRSLKGDPPRTIFYAADHQQPDLCDAPAIAAGEVALVFLNANVEWPPKRLPVMPGGAVLFQITYPGRMPARDAGGTRVVHYCRVRMPEDVKTEPGPWPAGMPRELLEYAAQVKGTAELAGLETAIRRRVAAGRMP